MSQILVLRIAEPASWVVTDASGACLGPISTGQIADAASLATGRRVVALAPGASITLANPELMVRGSRQAQVVPFALEESLAGDVEQFHFGIGQTDDAGRTEVAAVRREQMAGWLNELRVAGLYPDAILADLCCIPNNPGKAVAVLDGGQLIVRLPGALPVMLDAEPLTESFALAGLEGEGQHVQLYISGEDWEHSRDMIEALREVAGSLDVQLLQDGALPLLAGGAARSDALDLLQGEFENQAGWQAQWQRWRVAAFLAIGLLVLHFGVRGYDLISLGAEEARLDAAIEQGFRIALPEAERMVDARAQISQRLAGSGAGDPNGLLARLAAVSPAFSATQEARINSLGWRSGQLDLRVGAPSTEVLARLSEDISRTGLKSEVQSTSQREGGVDAQLLVSAGGAP